MSVLLLLAGIAAAQPAPPAPPVAGDGSADAALPVEGAAVGSVAGEDAVGELPPELKEMLDFEASLTYERGDVSLGGGKAVLHVPDSFGYLDAAETDKVLQVWGNPPDPNTWGMLVPSNTSIFAEEAWVVVVSYTDDGHIKDDDAADIDFTELLGQMQSDAAAESEARVKAGLTGVRIVGWAEPPHYDGISHKIYWAKELDFGEESHTLNYAIRALGREGVLEFNAVAPMNQIATIKLPMEQVMGFAEFTPGNRYEDFDESVDRVAEYGIAALVAGGVAAKTGLLKGLFAMLLAGKKLIVVGVIAAVGAAKAIFGKKDAAAS
ncbi:MAG: DUF2167 domain-containing protein [Pseudomonadota bacterium]|nr:DUF2167 domain-containing protein [Pseudomonadota bacterium]